MLKKSVFTFILALAGSFVVLHFFFQEITRRQEVSGAEQSRIIANDVKDRFSLYLNMPLTVGLLTSDNLGRGKLTNSSYGEFANLALKNNSELLGMSLIKADGRITQVYPYESNQKALGKITQHLQPLLASWERKDPYWFSPPFRLYQGQEGFVFYTPIVKKGVLDGWMATVISAKSFFNEFRAYDYFQSYELIIKDKETGKNYFATATDPHHTDAPVFEATSQIRGRDVIFQSWRKSSAPLFFFPWYWTLIGAMILASLATWFQRLHDDRKRASSQLKQISTLLRFTAKEALANLVEIHSELIKLSEGRKTGDSEVVRDVTYITNLIEQIDLLQTFAQQGLEVGQNRIELLPSIINLINDLQDITGRKNLKFDICRDNLKNVYFEGNEWLFQNSVLRNILTHLIIIAREGSQLIIDHKKTPENHEVIFRAEDIYQDNDKDNNLKLDRRLEIVKNVVKLYQGDLSFHRGMSNGTSIKLILPL